MGQRTAHQDAVDPIETCVTGGQNVVSGCLWIRDLAGADDACAVNAVSRDHAAACAALPRWMPRRRDKFTPIAQTQIDYQVAGHYGDADRLENRGGNSITCCVLRPDYHSLVQILNRDFSARRCDKCITHQADRAHEGGSCSRVFLLHGDRALVIDYPLDLECACGVPISKLKLIAARYGLKRNRVELFVLAVYG